MIIDELIFEPISDLDTNDKKVVDKHNTLIDSGSYNDATEYLNSNNYDKGMRSELFNNIANKVSLLGNYIINNPIKSDEIYSETEPIDSESNWWIQPVTYIKYYNASQNTEGAYENCELIGENNITLRSYSNGLELTNLKYTNGADTKGFVDNDSYIEFKTDLTNIKKLEIDAYMLAHNYFRMTINDIDVLEYKNDSTDVYNEIIENIGGYNFNGECNIRISSCSIVYGLNIFGIIGITM